MAAHNCSPLDKCSPLVKLCRSMVLFDSDYS